jgi:GAF domain-containing protein
MPNRSVHSVRDAEIFIVCDPVRTKLTQIVLDAEARGHGAFVASILMLKANLLYHLASPNLPSGYSRMIDGTEIGPVAGSCGTAAYCGHPIYVSDISTDPLWEPYPEISRLALDAGLLACWSMPIFHGKVIGTFAIYHREKRAPTLAERSLIHEAATSAAGLVAEALSRA